MINELTVSKGQLLEVLKKNKITHENTYKQAIVEYRKQAGQALKKQLNNVEEGKKFSLTFKLVKPLNYTNQYEKVIGMLEMSLEDKVLLSDNEYSQYVLDNWNWKTAFIGSTMSYTNNSGESAESDED
jgi:hypothetical protein